MMNPRTGARERAMRILRLHSNRRKPEDRMHTGQILALVGLRDTKTGDTICDESKPIVFESMTFPEPVISRSIEPRSTKDEGRLIEALERLVDEDPTCSVSVDKETGQRLLSGMGELHLDILIDRLAREFNVATHVGRPQVSYRESIGAERSEEIEYSQLIGGKRHYAKLTLRVAPVDRSKEVEFVVDKGGVAGVPDALLEVARQGIAESCSGGVLSGYPVIGVRVELKRAVYHQDDSTEMAYKIASATAFAQACTKASPVLLEPMMAVEVVVPDEYVGAVINDMNGRRGRVHSISHRKGAQVVDGEAPLAEMFGYATALRSLTQGRAAYTMQFGRYEQMPAQAQDAILRSIGRLV
jgi:elongation factor G